MKKIAKILKQALRKSAENILKEDLLKEQNQPGPYKLILKTCSHQTDGTTNPQNWNCKLYNAAAVVNVATQSYLQVGDCFSWKYNTGTNTPCNTSCPITCVVGITNIPTNITIYRDVHQCNDCALDSNNNGVPDCIDCPQVNGVTYGCMDPNITGPIVGAGANCSTYDPLTGAGCNLYDAAVNMDDGTCCSSGCTNPNATNYDPNACTDDGSCQAPNYDCINKMCEQNATGQGIHATLDDCLNSTECDRWECGEEEADPNQPANLACLKCQPNRYDEPSQTWDAACQYFSENGCIEHCQPPHLCDDFDTVIPPGGLRIEFCMQCQGNTTIGGQILTQFPNSQYCECCTQGDFGQNWQDITGYKCSQEVFSNISIDKFGNPVVISQNIDPNLWSNSLAHTDPNHPLYIPPTILPVGGDDFKGPCIPCGPNLLCTDPNPPYPCDGSIQDCLNAKNACEPCMYIRPVSHQVDDPLDAPPSPTPGPDASPEIDSMVQDVMPPEAELQEGVQIKGKMLDKLRMSKLAGIKRKKS